MTLHKLAAFVVMPIVLISAATLDVLHKLPHGFEVCGALVLINSALLIFLPREKSDRTPS